MTTILVEIRLLSEPRFDEVELGLPDDAPDALLLSFPLDNDLCHHIWKKIQDAVIKGSILITQANYLHWSIIACLYKLLELNPNPI